MTGNERVTDAMLDAYKLAFDGYMHDWLNGNFEPPSEDVGRHATQFALEAALSSVLPPPCDGVEAEQVVFDIIWPQQEWDGDEAFCREVAAKVVRSLSALAPVAAEPVAGEAESRRRRADELIADLDLRGIKTLGDIAKAGGANLRDFATWVDTWVSQPVTAFSVMALDGLFAQARERLQRLSSHPQTDEAKPTPINEAHASEA